MSSTPTTPSTPTTISSVIAKDWSWILSHLLALVIVGGLVIGGVYGVETVIARHDEQNASKYAAILATQTAQVQTLQKQLSTDEASWAQVEAQLLAQNAQLTQQIAARNQAAAIQVKQDATLSSQDAAEHITQQTKASPGEVTAQGNNVSVDLPIARVITADLDTLPVVQSNLLDTQTQLKNETEVAADAILNVTDAKKVIAAQTTQLADADKACQAQIKVIKAQARKSKIKSFLLGAATVLGFWAGHSL